MWDKELKTHEPYIKQDFIMGTKKVLNVLTSEVTFKTFLLVWEKERTMPELCHITKEKLENISTRMAILSKKGIVKIIRNKENKRKKIYRLNKEKLIDFYTDWVVKRVNIIHKFKSGKRINYLKVFKALTKKKWFMEILEDYFNDLQKGEAKAKNFYNAFWFFTGKIALGYYTLLVDEESEIDKKDLKDYASVIKLIQRIVLGNTDYVKKYFKRKQRKEKKTL